MFFIVWNENVKFFYLEKIFFQLWVLPSSNVLIVYLVKKKIRKIICLEVKIQKLFWRDWGSALNLIDLKTILNTS